MYSLKYEDPGIRSSSYDTCTQVVRYLEQPKRLALDLGCGTCRKLIDLAKYVNKYLAIDIRPELIECAQRLVTSAGVGNIEVHVADSRATPFDSHIFDLVTSFLSHFTAAEAFRLLEPGGRLIIETLGGDDKRGMKEAFGRDSLGFRGYQMTQSAAERRKSITASLSPFFLVDDIQDIRFSTTISRASLELLLQETPTVRNFDAYMDKKVVNTLCDADQNVTFYEHRLIIAAHARRAVKVC